jgi:hypothetical protein
MNVLIKVIACRVSSLSTPYYALWWEYVDTNWLMRCWTEYMEKDSLQLTIKIYEAFIIANFKSVFSMHLLQHAFEHLMINF